MKRVSRKQHGLLFDSKAEPAVWVSPGEELLVETWDALGGLVRKKSDMQKAIEWESSAPGMPLAGPICVEGAEKGDTLLVDIGQIRPVGLPCWNRIRPGYGHLTGDLWGQFLGLSPKPTVRICTVKGEKVHCLGRRLPFRPMIGCIGTSPEFETITNIYPGKHGGNMDLPVIVPGNSVYLPVFVKGAYLFLGDVHAIQGDGEVWGAVEMAADVTLRIRLEKNKRISWPRVQSKNHIMSVGSGKPLDDAVRIAYRELISWLQEDFGLERFEACTLSSLLGKVVVGQVINPVYTVATLFPREYLTSEREVSP